jgi:hypothetical protein
LVGGSSVAVADGPENQPCTSASRWVCVWLKKPSPRLETWVIAKLAAMSPPPIELTLEVFGRGCACRECRHESPDAFDGGDVVGDRATLGDRHFQATARVQRYAVAQGAGAPGVEQAGRVDGGVEAVGAGPRRSSGEVPEQVDDDVAATGQEQGDPEAETGKIPAAARVCPAWSTLRIDEVGIARPAGNSVTKPGAADSVIVTFSARATASPGTPAGSGTVLVVPGAILGPDRES